MSVQLLVLTLQVSTPSISQNTSSKLWQSLQPGLTDLAALMFGNTMTKNMSCQEFPLSWARTTNLLPRFWRDLLRILMQIASFQGSSQCGKCDDINPNTLSRSPSIMSRSPNVLIFVSPNMILSKLHMQESSLSTTLDHNTELCNIPCLDSIDFWLL